MATVSNDGKARLAVDIGGTFTDLALEWSGGRRSVKVLTTPRAPEEGVLTGVTEILGLAGLKPADLSLIIHGTTLATNAIIERKGAKTALVCTDGFRDSIEIAFEHRFEQYDIFMQKPPPLVARDLRFGVPERMDGRGNVLLPLDEAAVRALVPVLQARGVEAVAIGYMHAYLDGKHERRTRDILKEAMPGLSITLSSEVSPEIREYERWSTAVANAYVQPVMDRYLGRLDEALRARGVACPLFLITSGGGLAALDTARRFPIRLVESGPAGGAILAAALARQCGLDKVLSFDMGGTTAKICLIDDGEPQHSRFFEVARQYRFLKGSGLPLRIPVIEMVEIGAGGGSIASVDSMSRVHVGPESAGAEPGPASYGRGGTEPTVTDADVVLGRIDPGYFAGGSIQLSPDKAGDAVDRAVGAKLELKRIDAAFGISEIVEENMANAARVMVWWRQVATRPVLAYVVTGVPAAALGAGTMLRLPSTIVDGAIGLFFIAMVPGRRLIARTIGTLSLWHVAVAGAIIGFLTGIVVSTGPISVPVFVGYGLTGGGFIGTEAGASLAIFVAKALTFRSFGALPSETVFMGLGVGGALMAGTFLSKPFVQTMAPETFRLLMDGLMLVSGLSLLWAAIVG
ncbi:MAG: TSUP family transporter [Proteobacteria bacterium]|nr:TSUP family transporter [Pseudomonadota bacterium]